MSLKISEDLDKNEVNELTYRKKIELPKLIKENLINFQASPISIIKGTFQKKLFSIKDNSKVFKKSNFVHIKSLSMTKSLLIKNKYKLMKNIPKTSINSPKKEKLKSKLIKTEFSNKKTRYINTNTDLEVDNLLEKSNNKNLFNHKLKNCFSTTTSPLNSVRNRNNNYFSLSNIDFYSTNTCNSPQLYYRDIFNKKDYKQLTYNEMEINNLKEEYIRNIIFESIEKIRDNPAYIPNDILNKTELKTNFNDKDNLLTLTLSSINIEFSEIVLNGDNPMKFEIKLPFKYLTLFYYKGIEYFKIILTKIIKFTDNSYKKLVICYNEINSLINEELKKQSKGQFEFIKAKSSIMFENEISNININMNEGKIESEEKEINPNNNEIYNNSTILNSKSEIIEPINCSLNPDIKKIINYNYKSFHNLNYNAYEFAWVTPKISYKVTINLPVCKMECDKNNTIFQKYIETNFLFYLYEKKFLNWDFYMVNYLLKYKKYRYAIDNLFSKIKKKYNFMSKIIELAPKKLSTYSLKDIKINYIQTDDHNINSICEIKPFYLEVTLNSKIESNFIINFNFSHMRKLIIGLKYFSIDNVKDIFMKFVKLQESKLNQKIIFDYNLIDSMNEKEWDNYMQDIFILSGNNQSKCDSINKRTFRLSSVTNFNFTPNKQNQKKKNELLMPSLSCFNVDNNGNINSIFLNSNILDVIKKHILNNDLINIPDLVNNYASTYGVCKADSKNSKKTDVRKSAIFKKKVCK